MGVNPTTYSLDTTNLDQLINCQNLADLKNRPPPFVDAKKIDMRTVWTSAIKKFEFDSLVNIKAILKDALQKQFQSTGNSNLDI